MNDLEIRRKILAQRLLEVEDEALIAEIEQLLHVPVTYQLSAEQIAGLNEQLQEYLAGNAATSTWEEVKEKVAKRRTE